MEDALAVFACAGGFVAFAALVLFTIDCIDKRQRRHDREDVTAGAAVVAAVGVAAIALTVLNRASRQQGVGPTTAADRPECALCLGKLEDGEEWVVLTMCPHEFHRKCLAKWLEKKKSGCPTCGAVVWSGLMRETPALADMV